jgi:hypothetical protein
MTDELYQGWKNRETWTAYTSIVNCPKQEPYWKGKAKQALAPSIGVDNLTALLINEHKYTPLAMMPIDWAAIADMLMDHARVDATLSGNRTVETNG